MTFLSTRTLLQGALSAAFLIGSQASLFAGDKLVIEAGRIITLAGDEITDGVVVIENGRIAAIGTAEEVERPWDAKVIGGPDFVLAPGYVEALTSSGMDRPNEALDITPFLDVRDSIDPLNFYFEDCRRWGITTVNVQQGNDTVIAGQGRIVKPTGATIEEMTVRPSFGFKLSIAPKSGKSRSTQFQALRRGFSDFKRELESMVSSAQQKADFERREALAQGRKPEKDKSGGRPMQGSGWKVEGLELVDRKTIDSKRLPMLSMVEGRADTFIYCGAPMDVQPAIDFAKENGLSARATLVLHSSCWKAADAIAAAGMSVILDPQLVHVETDPVTEEETETFVPGVFAEKGIEFALASANSSTNSLWFQAAVCVSHGMSRGEALAAITKSPASILGLGDQVGSLEVGKAANILLLSGDPLDVTTRVKQVVIDGALIYNIRDDMRYRHLLEGVEPLGSVAAASTEVEVPSRTGEDKPKVDGDKPQEDEGESKEKGDSEDSEEETDAGDVDAQ